MNRIEDELRDLSDFLRRPQPQPPRLDARTPIIIQPAPASVAAPRLRVKDISVGGSSPIPETPLSGESRVMSPPRPPVRTPTRTDALQSVVSLSPPRSMPSPSIQSSLVSAPMSFLSSHHSDDLSLMESEEYPAEVDGDESPTITLSPSAESRVLSDIQSPPHQSPPMLSPLPSSPQLSPSEETPPSFDRAGPIPSEPPSSPSSSPPTTPPDSDYPSEDSVSSVATVRPRSQNLDALRDLLEGLRERTMALWDGQMSTNRMLDDLIARRPQQVPDNTETNDRHFSI